VRKHLLKPNFSKSIIGIPNMLFFIFDDLIIQLKEMGKFTIEQLNYTLAKLIKH
jgi:hypothetical protein